MVPSRDIRIVGVTLIDGSGAEPATGSTVEIRGGRIAEITSGDLPDTPGTEIVDGSGLTLLPGLIDCHIHLALNGGPNSDPDPGPDAFAVLRAARDAYRALAAGFTTVRDTGGVKAG